MIIRDDIINTIAWLHPMVLKNTSRIDSDWGGNIAKQAKDILSSSIEKVKRTDELNKTNTRR